MSQTSEIIHSDAPFHVSLLIFSPFFCKVISFCTAFGPPSNFIETASPLPALLSDLARCFCIHFGLHNFLIEILANCFTTQCTTASWLTLLRDSYVHDVDRFNAKRIAFGPNRECEIYSSEDVAINYILSVDFVILKLVWFNTCYMIHAAMALPHAVDETERLVSGENGNPMKNLVMFECLYVPRTTTWVDIKKKTFLKYCKRCCWLVIELSMSLRGVHLM